MIVLKYGLLPLIVCLTSIVRSQLYPLIEEPDNILKSLAKCVASISAEHIPREEIINVVSDSNGTDAILKYLVNQRSWPLFIHKYSAKQFNQEGSKSTNYIIYFEQLEDLRICLTFLQRSLSWNPFAKFLVTSPSVFHNPVTSVTNITEILWSFRVLNAVIMMATRSTVPLGLLNIYTWYPYANGNCANRFNETQLINRCQHGALADIGTNLFPNKIPHNLNGCYVKARAIGIAPFVILPRGLDRSKTNLNLTEGLEIQVLNTIANVANFKLNYSVCKNEFDFGQIIENAKKNSILESNGLMGALISEEVDLGLGCVGYTPVRYKYVDSTIPYLYDSKVWCVPHALMIPKWECLFTIFQLPTWSLTLLTLVLATFCLWAQSYDSPKESATYKVFQSCSSNMFASLLGISVPTQPKTVANRVFFMIWIIFALHLNIFYQTGLMSVLTSPSYEKQITSVEEIFEEGLSFGTIPLGMRYFQNQKDWRMKKVFEEGVICIEPVACMRTVAKDRNYAFAFTKMFMQYIEGQFIRDDGESELYMFKDRVVLLLLIMSMRRGFPLTQRIRDLVVRISEAGLIPFWFSKLAEKKGRIGKGPVSSQEKLTIYNLQAPFFLLALGILLAIIVLLGEIVVSRHRKSLSNNECVAKTDNNLL